MMIDELSMIVGIQSSEKISIQMEMLISLKHLLQSGKDVGIKTDKDRNGSGS